MPKVAIPPRAILMNLINSMKPHPTMPNYAKPSQAKLRERISTRLGKSWVKTAAKKGVSFNLQKFEHNRIKSLAKRHVKGLSAVKKSQKQRQANIERFVRLCERKRCPGNIRIGISPRKLAKHM